MKYKRISDKFYKSEKVHRIRTLKSGRQQYIAYKFVLCAGKAVTVPGFETFDFFTHNEGKNLSEATTGAFIFDASKKLHEKELINFAAKRLKGELKDAAEEIRDFSGGDVSDHYAEALQGCLDTLINQYGLSPRYQIEGEDF